MVFYSLLNSRIVSLVHSIERSTRALAHQQDIIAAPTWSIALDA
jgi:hypothetical protein